MKRSTSDARLLRLAKLLEALPPERFNFNVWVGANWKGSSDLSCGTSACALGWATTIPQFREFGLRLVRNPAYSIGGGGGYVALYPRGSAARSVGLQRAVHVEAGAVIFGVTSAEAGLLFLPSRTLVVNGRRLRSAPAEAKPKQVAGLIRRFITARAGVAA